MTKPILLAHGHHFYLQVESHLSEGVFSSTSQTRGGEVPSSFVLLGCTLLLRGLHSGLREVQAVVCLLWHAGAGGALLSAQRIANWICNAVHRSYEAMVCTPQGTFH